MKITPNNALFSAISQFPDPAQVRAKQARTAVQQPTVKPDDARSALIRDALRQAAQNQAKQTGQGRQPATAAKAPARSAEVQAVAPAQDAVQPYAAGSVRREVPLADVRPTFVRLGQIIDLKV